jgi:2-polyprenyl-3-methyl-5-hydroxy-6-metoxy-1,4-benzoquinol methylase
MVLNRIRNRLRKQSAVVIPESQRESVLTRYGTRQNEPLTYATARDFCDSADHLGTLMLHNGDLKDVQRPWTLKTIVAAVPPPARLLEIGAGEPRVAAALAELGYDVTVVDPYDGSGNGPYEYEHFKRIYPRVRILRARFNATLAADPETFDAIYSISVLEHLQADEVYDVFAAMTRFLRQGGHSIHCVDSVIAGRDLEYHDQRMRLVIRKQHELAGSHSSETDYDSLLGQIASDVDAYYLSAEGHNLWRGTVPYDEFPYRRVISLQSCAQRR